jgi:hypothetical protein
MVQFTKYNPNAEIIHRGTITTSSLKPKADRSKSRSRPLPHRNSYDNQDWEHSGWDSVCDRYEHDEYRDNDRYYQHQSLSQSPSPRREMHYIISPSYSCNRRGRRNATNDEKNISVSSYR